MKILMLGWELPPHNSGGLGVACYHMAKAIAKQGVDIDFVVPYTAKHPNIDFMNIHCVTKLSPLDRYGLGAYDSKYLIKNGLDEADACELKDMRGVQKRYIKFVERLVEETKPEVIHAHDWLTMEAGVRAKEISGAPLFVHVHATEFDRSGEVSGNPLVHEIEYQGLMMADRIFAVSGITKRIIVERYNIPEDKVEVVYNAIDVADLGNHEYDMRTYKYLEHLKSEGYAVAATVTRFTVQKGLTYFMEAAAKASQKYDKLVFLLAGDGEQRDELIEMAARHGISDRVFFTGFVRGKQWRDAYNVADLFVMTSVSEPFGLTALEAAHHETALAISRQSGVGEVVNSVLRFDFWDTDRLADQMIGVATSPALMRSLKENIKEEYDRMSWNDIAEQCVGIYNRYALKNISKKGSLI